MYTCLKQKNIALDKTMECLNIETFQQIRMIEKADEVNVVKFIWERDFLTNHQAFVKSGPVISPLNPRDAFYGGRTNCAWLKYEAEIDEKIRYYDFCSLYPYTNKYAEYPIGHPTIILENFDNDITHYYGLVKCNILPPQNLYHPV